MYTNEISVVGFPKCGTSALMRELGARPEIKVLRTSEGELEFPWPMIKELSYDSSDTVLAHKFTAYIYSTTALRFLSESNPSRIVVLCVRDPVKSLLSWHNMHRKIARSGTEISHFAYKEREFYSSCSLAEYMDRFARQRLRYDYYFSRLIDIVPSDRVIVIWQERMAQGVRSVANYVHSCAIGDDLPTIDLLSPNEIIHKGFADNASDEIPHEIKSELSDTENNLRELIINSGVRHLPPLYQ